MLPNKTISVVTVSYFSELTLLASLLDSLKLAAKILFERTAYRLDYYIIDNSVDEQYYASLKKLLAETTLGGSVRLQLIASPANAGYGAGNNQINSRLNSDYHLILNPDVELHLEALYQAVKYMEGNHDVAMLSPQIINQSTSYHVVKAYPDCFTLLLRYFNISLLNKRYAERLSRYQCTNLGDIADKSVALAGGCFLFVRTDWFNRIEGFDEYFFMYFEDFDLSIRLRSHGNIAYVPQVMISHAGGGVGRKTWRHHFLFAVSAIKFFNRYGWRLC